MSKMKRGGTKPNLMYMITTTVDPALFHFRWKQFIYKSCHQTHSLEFSISEKIRSSLRGLSTELSTNFWARTIQTVWIIAGL